MNYIDRNAVPHARVQGLEEDLNLTGVQYNIVLSLTFIGYILMQGTFSYNCDDAGCRRHKANRRTV
jgi:hypothetical protein